MSETNGSASVRMTSRVDSHQVLDWTDDDIRTPDEQAWPVITAKPRIDSMSILEPTAVPVLVLKLVPTRPIGEVDRTLLAGDLKLMRYALDEYDRSLGGGGLVLTTSEPTADGVMLTLAPLMLENADERLKQIVQVLERDNSNQPPVSEPEDESPVSGLILVRPRFGELRAEIAYPSKV